MSNKVFDENPRLGAIQLAILIWRMFYLMVVQRQWLRLALTICWLAGIVEFFRHMDSGLDGSTWHVMGFFAISFVWIVGGLVMNQSVIRECALSFQASRKEDGHA